MIDLLIYPLIAGLLIALIGGPMGSLIVWQRMAYLGESVAHSALLGVALGIWLEVGVTPAIILVCCGLAMMLNRLQSHLGLSLNTVLAIMAHTSLAGGLVILSLIPGLRLDVNALLFGDLLTVDRSSLLLTALITILLLVFMATQWRALVSLCANEELAAVEGIPVGPLKTFLNLSVALLVAVGIKTVGVLLIISLLVIPAATSRKWARSPEIMAGLASAVGLCAVCVGLFVSYRADTPVGPTIVVVAGLGYFVSQLLCLMPAFDKKSG